MNQLTIHLQNGTGIFSCEEISGVPSIRPCYLLICHTDSQASQQLAKQLRDHVVFSIRQMTGSSVVSTCSSVTTFVGSSSYEDPNTKKLLIAVGDGSNGSIQFNDLGLWNHDQLPVLQKGKTFLFPPSIAKDNALWWKKSIAEAFPRIMGMLEISSNDFKVFISYKRSDTEHMAEQLYDALGKSNYDVFLDRFSIDPGIWFQNRLYQELCDKTIVLILESQNLSDSPWTLLEIAFSKKYRLGIRSLHLPGSPVLSDIDNSKRRPLTSADFQSGALHPLLTDKTIEDIITEMNFYHFKALLYKRLYLQLNVFMGFSFRNEKAVRDQDGCISYTNKRNGKSYRIWTTPRPPEIKDFVYIDNCNPMKTNIIIGPEFQESSRAYNIEWLSKKSCVKFFNEWQIMDMVDKVIAGKI